MGLRARRRTVAWCLAGPVRNTAPVPDQVGPRPAMGSVDAQRSEPRGPADRRDWIGQLDPGGVFDGWSSVWSKRRSVRQDAPGGLHPPRCWVLPAHRVREAADAAALGALTSRIDCGRHPGPDLTQRRTSTEARTTGDPQSNVRLFAGDNRTCERTLKSPADGSVTDITADHVVLAAGVAGDPRHPGSAGTLVPHLPTRSCASGRCPDGR